jgi:hypothetical protein
LEGDGYEVVGEGSTPGQLARLVADHRPDVVVLDDTIGATAPQIVREISPRSRIVLVWPGAVVPIGGDARVEPAQVLRQLGPTVAKVAAGVAGFTTIERPEWVEKVRKDPATLRERLERSGGLPKRPSVTELQRRGQRLQPASPGADEVTDDDRDEVAPVLPLATAAGAAALAGVAAGAGTDTSEATIELPDTEQGAAVLHLPDEQAGGAVVVPIAAARRATDPSATELNRRLGTIALGGAAVVGAVVFALALGGSRVSTDIIVAEGPRGTIEPGPPIDSGIDPEPGPDGEPGGRPDGDGTETPPDLTPSDWPYTDGGGAGGSGGPTGGGERPPAIPDGALEPPPEVPGGGGSEPPPSVAPGRSGLFNPHGGAPGLEVGGPHGTRDGSGDHPQGGPPGQTGDHPQGGPPGQTGDHPHGGAPGQHR